MTERKQDRRIRRTRWLLRQAMAELMNEKEFKDITVKEIAERADLNRGTFYFHYTDTYDLKAQVEDELVTVFSEYLESYHPTNQNHSIYGFAEASLSYIQENHFLIKTLFHDTSGDSLRNKMTHALEETIARVQQSCVQESAQEGAYIRRFLANGVIGALAMWIEQGNGMSEQEMTAILNDLIMRVFPEQP